MRPIPLEVGDRALIKKNKSLISEIICWKTNSRFSHCEPIIDPNGLSIDATMPYPRMNNIWNYDPDRYRVIIIRPCPSFTSKQKDAWLNEIIRRYELSLRQPAFGYDALSYLGFASNKDIDDKKRITCSDFVLAADHAAGILLLESGRLVSPQSYWDYTVAGRFKILL